jgi:hypothetical protein
MDGGFTGGALTRAAKCVRIGFVTSGRDRDTAHYESFVLVASAV